MEARTKHEWSRFLELFLSRNENRPTRLGIFVEEDRGTQDFWVEDGLPLTAVTVEPKSGRTDVEMIFGSRSDPDERTMTHVISDARSMKMTLGVSIDADTLEFADAEGRNTVLRFENFPDR